jgi:hypothetical protein
MGLGVVLIVWAVVGLLLATIAAGVLLGLTALFTRKALRFRRTLLICAALLPFGCLAWAGIVFVFQAVVNEGLLHRDVGLGDGWHTPLPNGYMISFIDITDQGTVYNPKTQLAWDSVVSRPDAVFGVRTLQVAGAYLIGGADSHYFESIREDRGVVDSYFLLDTRTGKKTSAPDLTSLAADANRVGISLHLEPIYSVYSRYRFTWFEVFAGCLLVLPPLTASVALVVAIQYVRQHPNSQARTYRSLFQSWSMTRRQRRARDNSPQIPPGSA